jgi:hypothetical protein
MEWDGLVVLSRMVLCLEVEVAEFFLWKTLLASGSRLPEVGFCASIYSFCSLKGNSLSFCCRSQAKSTVLYS